jgi:hypothetical protein
MITDVAQRHRDRSVSYRPAGEPIDTRSYEVASIPDDTTAKAFVCRHHYSGSYVAARFRLGLYRRAALVGVAVFSVPANMRALACLPGAAEERVELGRFVLVDDVPANGESWFLARAFETLRAGGVVGVVAFSDPTKRTDASGAHVFRGHVGTIYQASNAVYLGRSKAERRRLLPDGTVIHNRALAKIRGLERGWRYAIDQLVAHGAEPLRAGEDAREWLARELPRVTRPLRHEGNFKYAWTLRRRDRRHLPASLPYPKLHVREVRDAA